MKEDVAKTRYIITITVYLYFLNRLNNLVAAQTGVLGGIPKNFALVSREQHRIAQKREE